MSNVTHQLGASPSYQRLDRPETSTPLMDETPFRQLFQSVGEAKKIGDVELSKSPGHTVGNSTVGCQGDGASTDDDLTDDENRACGICNTDTDRRDADEDKNKSNNNQLTELMGAFNPHTNRRVFTDFEAAGLPRKEIIRLAQALHDSVSAGRQTVSLGLRTPTLGELRFDVRIAGNIVFIHAFVESEQAAQALALAISTLREKLEERQLILGRLDVTTKGRYPTADGRAGKDNENGEVSSPGHKRKEAPLPSLERLENAERIG